MDINNPPQEEFEKIRSAARFNTSEIEFEFDVLEELKQYRYYIINSKGIQELHPAKLRGTAKFTLDDDGEHIVRVTYYGRIIALVPSKNRIDGGFALISSDQDFPKKASDSGGLLRTEVKNSDLVTTFTKYNGTVLTLTEPVNHPDKIMNYYSLSIANEDYIFVQWAPDKECHYGCCEFIFSIFKAGDGMTSVGYTAYGCDM